MIRIRTSSNCSCKRRPAENSARTSPKSDELLEEIRQLRAALAVYRKLVDRLLEQNRAA
jgi:hypothetical protein